MRVTPAHVRDESDLIGSMLVRVVVGSARAVTERLNGAIKAAFPAVDVLSVGLVLDGGSGHTKFISIFNQG